MFPSCLSYASGNASNSRQLLSFLWTARLTLDAPAGDGYCVHLNTLGTAVSIKDFFTTVLPATKSVIFVDACTTLVVHLMCSFRILSLRVTPHIHLSIPASFTYSRAYCLVFVAQVSAPYNRAGLTTVLSTFPFSFTGILLSHNTPLHLFQFIHAALTLCVIYVAMPPVSSTLEPRHLNCCTLRSSLPKILTGSLPWPLACPKLQF